MKKTEKTLMLSQQQIEDISTQFVVSNLLEYLLRKNFDLLSCTKKAEYQALMMRLKWINKETESKCSESLEDDLYNDSADLYHVSRKMVQVTKEGRLEELLEMIRNF